MMIFVACILTVLIEVPFLMLFGYRSRDDCIIIACTNVITNLILNIVLLFAGSWLVYPLEVLVVAAEYLIYAKAFSPSFKLFGLTLAANVLSYSIGLLIF